MHLAAVNGNGWMCWRLLEHCGYQILEELNGEGCTPVDLARRGTASRYADWLTGRAVPDLFFFQSGRSRILPDLEWQVRPEPDFQINCNFINLYYIIYTNVYEWFEFLITFLATVTVTSFTYTHAVIYATAMSRKNWLFKLGKTIRLRWDFCRSWIWKCRIPTRSGVGIRYSPTDRWWLMSVVYVMSNSACVVSCLTCVGLLILISSCYSHVQVQYICYSSEYPQLAISRFFQTQF